MNDPTMETATIAQSREVSRIDAYLTV